MLLLLIVFVADACKAPFRVAVRTTQGFIQVFLGNQDEFNVCSVALSLSFNGHSDERMNKGK